MIPALLDRFRHGDRLALARLLSLAARGESLPEIDAALPAPAKPARVVAITGPGGVGKSTLVGKLLAYVRAQGLKVAVLACDPQSPLSGGALLGDRFRMPTRPDDDGVFIRSLATVSGRGAVAEHLPLMVRLLETFGFDVVLIETVGAGQGDTAVRELADVMVLLLQPETGDDLQWEKAGVLEVADIVVIHKADLPGAEQALAQVQASLHLSAALPVAVLPVSARSGRGIDELWKAIQAVPARSGRAARGRDWPHLADAIGQEVLARARGIHGERVKELLAQYEGGSLSAAEAARRLVDFLQDLASGGA